MMGGRDFIVLASGMVVLVIKAKLPKLVECKADE